VKVGHRQDLIRNPSLWLGFFYALIKLSRGCLEFVEVSIQREWKEKETAGEK
jgi:hypothetical protein